MARLSQLPKYGTLEIRVAEIADRADIARLGGIKPRVFPTLIAFHDGKPALGWEGFAALAPLEISDGLVIQALDAALALDTSPQPSEEQSGT